MPRIAHEAVISWLTSLVLGGFFKERYASVIRQAVEVDGVAFRHALIEAAGRKWGVRLWHVAADGHPETSAKWAQPLRRVVWWRACFRSPASTIQRFFAFVMGELRLRFEPAVPWIAILGSDGSEKSSVANEIVHRFAACPYGNVKAFHWHPRLIAPPAQGADGLRLLVLAADWLLDYWTRFAHLRAKGYILAFERTYFDLVCDHERYRYGAGPRLARALSWLLPKPDLVFLLDSDPDALPHRTRKALPSDLARHRHAYRALVRERPAGHVLDGSLSRSALADEIQRVIRAWMLDRSAASLRGVRAPIVTAPTAHTEGSSGAPTVSRGAGAR